MKDFDASQYIVLPLQKTPVKAVKSENLKSEEEVLNQLANWIQKQKIKVMQDHKRNSNNLPIFSVTGNQHKPDIIAMGGQITAIEIKTGYEGNALGTNSGIVTYFKNYCEGRTSYFDEHKKPIKIDNFVLATQYSFSGRFKETEAIHQDTEKRDNAAKKGWLPTKEFESTFNILRHGIWQQIDLDRYRNCGVGIGALLSTLLGYIPNHYYWKKINISTDIPMPAVEVKKPNPVVLNKDGGHRWGFEWRPI